MPDITSHHHQLATVSETPEPTEIPGVKMLIHSCGCTCGEVITARTALAADMAFHDHQRRGAERYITDVLLEGWGEPLLFTPAVTSTNNDGFIDRIYLDNEDSRAMKVTITPDYIVHNYTLEIPE